MAGACAREESAEGVTLLEAARRGSPHPKGLPNLYPGGQSLLVRPLLGRIETDFAGDRNEAAISGREAQSDQVSLAGHAFDMAGHDARPSDWESSGQALLAQLFAWVCLQLGSCSIITLLAEG